MADARVFFALWPDADTAKAIDAAADALACDGRRVARDRLHLTLAFLGRADTAALADLCRRAAAVRVPEFTLVLDRVGYFKRPRVLWLGATNVPRELEALAQAVNGGGDDNAAAPAYRPHITVARRAARPQASAAIAPIEWRVREFCLVESGRNGTPGGYTRLGGWQLG